MGSSPSTPTKKIKHGSSNIDKRHNSSCSTQVKHTKKDDVEDVHLTIESQKGSKLMLMQENTLVYTTNNNNDSQREDEKSINSSEQEIVKGNDVCEFSNNNNKHKSENNSVVNDSTNSVNNNNNTVKRLFTLSDVQNMHRGNPNCILIIVENDLYDLTAFAQHHPGGSAVLRDYSGTDATSIFQSIHSDDAYVELKHWFLGHFSNDLRGDNWTNNNSNNNYNDNQLELTSQTNQSGSNIARALPTEEIKLQNLAWMLERPYPSKLEKQITSQEKENKDNVYTNQNISGSGNKPSANNEHDDNVNSAIDSNDNSSSSCLPVENGEVTMEAIETYIHDDKCNEHSKRYVIILFGDVYDVSNYAEMHPGGIRVFDKNNGKECGSIFIRIHGLRARKLVNEFYVGRLKGSRLQRPSSLSLPQKLPEHDEM